VGLQQRNQGPRQMRGGKTDRRTDAQLPCTPSAVRSAARVPIGPLRASMRTLRRRPALHPSTRADGSSGAAASPLFHAPIAGSADSLQRA
jgi:hypothetical protein